MHWQPTNTHTDVESTCTLWRRQVAAEEAGAAGRQEHPEHWLAGAGLINATLCSLYTRVLHAQWLRTPMREVWACLHVRYVHVGHCLAATIDVM